jgi:hypothetical protein
MRVGAEILSRARALHARVIFVVGTGRNVGKTTTLRAIYNAACDEGETVALASVGPAAKPRMRLRPGTIFTTTRALLPESPAAQLLRISPLQSSAGSVLYAQVVCDGLFELSGPPTASGVREVLEELQNRGRIAVVDGAVDRIAALAGSSGAVVVAGGAADAPAFDEAVAGIAALTARLRIPAFDASLPAIEIDGALTAGAAAEFMARGESRQIVVRDPTQIALTGRAASQALDRLKIRCRRPLHVIAVTIASIASERQFEPRRFGEAVAAATQLPSFDIYRGAQAA